MTSRKVNIYWIRHGASCTNAIARSDPWYMQWKRLIYLDPPLIVGAKQDISNQRKLARDAGMPTPDYVFSSRLLRAIMTAKEWFPKRQIVAMCGNQELVRGRGNEFSSAQYQRDALEKFGLNANNVVYTYALDSVCNSKKKRDAKVFYKLLGEYIAANSRGVKELNIVVVGHSEWMLANVLKTQKSKNLGVWKTEHTLIGDALSPGSNLKNVLLGTHLGPQDAEARKNCKF